MDYRVREYYLILSSMNYTDYENIRKEMKNNITDIKFLSNRPNTAYGYSIHEIISIRKNNIESFENFINTVNADKKRIRYIRITKRDIGQ